MYVNIHSNICASSAECEVSSDLSEEDFTLFYPVCKTLSLPVQAPMSVRFLKKISVVEEPTGRIIEYKSSSDSTNPKSICSSIVSLTHDSFGQIENIFIYRGVNFVIAHKFECAVRKNDGLVHIVDCTVNHRALFPLEEVSRPHLIAVQHIPELWILNA